MIWWHVSKLVDLMLGDSVDEKPCRSPAALKKSVDPLKLLKDVKFDVYG